MSSEPDSFYRDILDSLSDGVYFTDTERRISFWNRGAERLSGFRREEVLGRCCSDNILVHIDKEGNPLCTDGCPLSATLQDGETREAEVFLHHKEGFRVPVFTRITPIRDGAAQITGAVEIFNSNIAKQNLEQRLAEMEQLALVDSLTGLPNRRYIENQIHSRLEELKRNAWSFGILFIDIDRFKEINDTFGHGTGDLVLRMVGNTLDANSRYFDAVGRWGGEEFLAVVANTHYNILKEVGERFRSLVSRSSIDEPHKIDVTISVGGTEAEPGDSLESLLQRADQRLYEAKKSGRNRVCV